MEKNISKTGTKPRKVTRLSMIKIGLKNMLRRENKKDEVVDAEILVNKDPNFFWFP